MGLHEINLRGWHVGSLFSLFVADAAEYYDVCLAGACSSVAQCVCRGARPPHFCFPPRVAILAKAGLFAGENDMVSLAQSGRSFFFFFSLASQSLCRPMMSVTTMLVQRCDAWLPGDNPSITAHDGEPIYFPAPSLRHSSLQFELLFKTAFARFLL